MKFGVGQSSVRKEDDALLRGARPLCGRSCAGEPAACGGAALAACACALSHHRRREGPRDARRGARAHRRGDRLSLAICHAKARCRNATINVPPYPILVQDEVRHVGDAIAFVVADTVEQANDAAEAIAIDWEPLPHVIGAVAALESGAPQVWPDKRRQSRVRDARSAMQQATGTALLRRPRKTVSLTDRQPAARHQLSRHPRRHRRIRRQPDRFTLTLGSQGSHAVRDMLCARAQDSAGEDARDDAGCRRRLRHQAVSLPRISAGGGRGAKRFKRPVKWVADRTEHFLGDTQGRDNLTTAKLALDENRQVHRARGRSRRRYGRVSLALMRRYIPCVGAGMSPGVYDIPTCHVRVRGAFTNTVPVDAYRGAGRPEAAYLIERLVDAAARELGVGPDALRRKNFIKPKRDALHDRDRQGLRFRRVRRAS